MEPLFRFELIEEYIAREKITKKEFCRRCKISLSTFYRIKNGYDFDLHILFKFAKVIGVPHIADLFDKAK